MTLQGADVADHQGVHPAYPPGTEFVIIKASGGHDYRNPLLGQQVADAKARGLLYGFYHFMYEPTSGGGDVAREAANFIEAVRPYVEPGVSFWLDVEEYPATVGYTGNLAAWLVAFCEAVHSAYGAVCGIYCATWYLTATGMDKADHLSLYPFWMASWQQAIPDPHYMAPWDHLTLHQYNADGIDKDRFYGSREQFLALGVPAPAKVIEKKQDTGQQKPEGYLEVDQPDVFKWEGAGVIVYRKSRWYNPLEGKYYEREWSAEQGYTPWVEVA